MVSFRKKDTGGNYLTAIIGLTRTLFALIAPDTPFPVVISEWCVF